VDTLTFEIPKPADLFAHDFLQFLKAKTQGKWAIEDCTIKVVYCKDDLWDDLGNISDAVTIGTPEEYAERPDTSTVEGWRKVNAFYLLPARKENDRVSITKLSRQERKFMLADLGFVGSLGWAADPLSIFDAVVFLNQSAVVRRARSQIAFPDHQLIAHEVAHIAEKLSGGQIHLSQWLNSRLVESPDVEKLFMEFLEATGTKEFARRYMAHQPVP